jgi:hypothetical protein
VTSREAAVNRFTVCTLAFAAPALVAAAQMPKAPPPHARKAPLRTDPAEAAALTKVLRDLARKHLPDPLSKSSRNWGKQTAVTVVRRYRDGLRIYSEAVQELRNDGHWKRTTVRVPEPDNLAIAVTELTHPSPGRMLATVAVVAERVDLRFEQQLWRNGLRLYSGETRAHCKGGLLVKAEVVSKARFQKGSFFPEMTLMLRVTDADLFYEKLVVDHTAGVDGDAARVIGNVLIDLVKAVKPDVEKELREKAEAAVVKAVGIREFKVALDRLFRMKPGP